MLNLAHAHAPTAPTRSPSPASNVRKAAHVRGALALLEAAQRTGEPDAELTRLAEQCAALLATLEPMFATGEGPRFL